MYNYQYVEKCEWMPVKKELISLINEVQDIVREDFTFSFEFIGSTSRNMITCDYSSNVGFDFDVNLQVNDDEENYSTKEIKDILIRAFDSVCNRYGYCEDSTRVFTIKFIDYENSRVVHSCDFAIVEKNDDEECRDQYIRNNKKLGTYTWEYQTKGYEDIGRKMDAIKDKGLWSIVREVYIDKKNSNDNKDKKSRALFAESINEVFNQNFNR